MVATKLYIGNVPPNYDEVELRSQFEKFGNVVEFDILKDYGFVHFESEQDAKQAVENLDGFHHQGQQIKVEMSRSTVRQRPGMGGKGECYRCGGDGHWSKECPKGPGRGRGGGRGGRGGRDRDFGGRGGGGYRNSYLGGDSYDMYSRRDAYERMRFAPYERRLPALPPRDYYGLSRDAPSYFRRSPPRDYYDYYLKRMDALDRYGDAPSRSAGGGMGMKDDLKTPLMRNPMGGGRSLGRIPGPY